MTLTNNLRDELHSRFGLGESQALGDYAFRLHTFLNALQKLQVLTNSEAKAYQAIKKSIALCSITKESEKNYTRKELYNSLTTFPFLSALQLIVADEINEVTNQHFRLLSHLFLARSHADYPAYLSFYKAFLEGEHGTRLFLTPNYLELCTLDELELKLKTLAEIHESESLRSAASFFKLQTFKLTKPKRKLTTGTNRHETIIEENSAGILNSVRFSDEAGNETSAFLKLTPRLALSEAKKRNQFSKKQAGLQNALYNFESATPWAGQHATPAEVTRVFRETSPQMLDGDFSALSPQSARLLFFFCLKLLGLIEPERLILLNSGSPNYKPDHALPNHLVYEIDKPTQRVDAHLRLNASLLTVQPPKNKEARIHHAAHNHIDFSLPFPLPQLLKVAFKGVSPNNRNHRPLGHALKVDSDSYSKWLHGQLKTSRLNAIGISSRRLESAFHHYAKEKVPEVFLNYLRGQASVQHHYASVPRREIEWTIKAAWLAFIDNVGIARTSSASDNFAFAMRLMHHDDVGSSHVIREELLSCMLSHCLKVAELRSSPHVERLNNLALYIYLRVATTSALRPVKEPLPESCHFHPSLGLLSVADKRTHHKKERRLIVLVEGGAALLDAFKGISQRLSGALNLPVPTSSLMIFDAKTKSWQALSRSLVNQVLNEYVGDVVENRSFRHVAASNFLKELLNQGDFSQSSLNLLMNHSRANVSVLNRRSLIHLESLSSRQRALIDASDRHAKFDIKAYEILRRLEGDLCSL